MNGLHRSLFEIVCGLGTAALLTCSLNLVFSRGQWRVPRTFASKMGRVPQESEDALILLAQARNALPPGSTVVFFKPHQRSELDDQISFLVAAGQLAEQRVVPAYFLTSSPGPDFVVTFRSGWEDSRYTRLHDFPEGDVYRRN